MIKDSGNRTKFSSGATRDIQTEKGRCDLLPLDIVSDYIQYSCTYETPFYDILESLNNYIECRQDTYLFDCLDSFCDLSGWLPPEMILDVSIHFKDGAEKYSENNWKKGIPEWSYISSAIRHLFNYVENCKDERHDRAFVWNILCLLWTHRHITISEDKEFLKDE